MTGPVANLRQLIANPGFVVVPCVCDALTAVMAEQAGYGVALSWDEFHRVMGTPEVTGRAVRYGMLD